MGFGGGQGLRLLSNIVLAQVLLTDDFGLMGKVTVILTGLLMFSDIGIGPALISSKRTDAAFRNTAWTIQVGRGFLLWGAAAALAQPLSVLLNAPGLTAVLPVVAASAAIQGLQSSNWFSANRELSVGRMMGIELGTMGVLVSTMVFWAYAIDASVWALVVGNLASAVFHTAMSHTLPGIRNRLRLEREAAGELIRFGRWLFLSTVITFFAMQIDKLLLMRFTTTQTFGVFYIGMQLANLGPTLALKVAHLVGFPVISEVYRERPAEFSRAFVRVQTVTLLPVHAALLGMILLGPSLFYLFYPVSYWGAGWIVQVLSLNAVVGLLNTSYGNAFMATGNTFYNMLISLIQVAVTTAAVLTGYAVGGETGFLLGLAVCQYAAYPLDAAVADRMKIWQPRFDLPLIAATTLLSLAALWGAQQIAPVSASWGQTLRGVVAEWRASAAAPPAGTLDGRADRADTPAS
ncbi:putative polysaccharide biosynthesis protein [Phycisphaera mikurensis NBRC 102666]|uniref:Putative polysaccharide biosynthesis protein n=1 Tax=Phycisphaera mikurensis (strain NBRC 102666 / KCTC 22515 / FYK2301M01) TaxID=1142394 RepID=I0IAZ1_PHYMF|nr:putative polysaccharide biosynthesis protein [Phycisphaera mikurensis NBRC 102666]